MRLKDLLGCVDKSTWVQIEFRMYDMQFSTKHSAEFYEKAEKNLLEKIIDSVYVHEDTLIVKLI